MADGHLGKCKVCTRADSTKHRIEHRTEALANHAVQNAVRTGRLSKGPCEICGNPKAHGHHDDYSKPLEVRWLCALHHKQLHKAMKVNE